MSAEWRPYFTYLTRSKDGAHGYKKLKQYSGIIIRLKAHITERSTVILNDSLDRTTDCKTYLRSRPVPYCKPSIDCYTLNLDYLKENPEGYTLDPRDCKSIEDFRPYAEAQILGGVPIDDIEEDIFISPRHLDGTLKDLLEKRGIANCLLEPDKYELNMDWVNEHLAVGGSIHPEEIKALASQGITHVVDTRAERCDDKDTLTREKIDWLHLPTPDNHPLSIKQLMEGTTWVNERTKKGERVLIHCEYGVGRSVLLTCAVLITQGMDASTALDLVKQQRGQADPNPQQIAQLREFEAIYRASELDKGDSQKVEDE